MSELKYVGKRLIREDVYDKARGKTEYTCDRKLHDMLYAKLVLSEKAHAEISIDIEDALKVPGIEAVFTHKDVPKKMYNPQNWTVCIEDKEDMYILADKARYVGDHLALVVGKTKEAVEEAVSLVHVTYKEETPVIGFEAARNTEGCLEFEKEMKCGDFESLDKEDLVIVETQGSTPMIHHAPIETHIALSQVDETGNLVVWTPCQTVFMIRKQISELLDLPYSRVRVVKAVMGGSFGGKGHAVVEPVSAFASWTLKKPVMVYMDRPADIMASRRRNSTDMVIKTAATKDGKIVGRRIDCDFDGGAYYTNGGGVAAAFAKKLFRLYRIENQTIHVRTFATNTVPGGSCRGVGSPQAHAVSEVNIDQLANKLGMDPCEFRMKNVVLPWDDDPSGGTNLGDARIKDCIEKGMEAFEWKEKRAHIKERDTDRYAYGVGMAGAVHGNGYTGAFPDFTNVDMQIHPDGNAEVHIAVHDQGCGTVMTMQQVAAEALHLDFHKIRVYEADTFVSPYDSAGTQASRVTYVCGKAVQKAGEELLDKLKNACAILYGWEKDSIQTEDGIASYEGPSGKESKTYGEISREYELKCSRYLKVQLEYESPTNPGVYAAAFAQVRVDKYTGQVEVQDLMAVHDIGQCMNETLSEGQVEGGAQMSIGLVLWEGIVYDAKGNVKTKNFSKYHIINAPDMPKVRSVFIENHNSDGPYGAKSLGELVAVAPGPAVVNAINFALGSCLTNYPITPEKVVAFLESKEK